MYLIDAVRQVMSDPDLRTRYPDGMMPAEVLAEIRVKYGEDAFELCTVIDVADELTALYGSPR